MAQAGAGGAATPVPPGSPLANLAGTAARLPVALRAAVSAMAANLTALRSGSTRSDLDSAWRSEVYGFCSKALDNRYPLVRASAIDVNLDDFTRLFKPGGLIDSFVTARIKPFVDTGRTPWKASSELVIAPDALAQFQRAAIIRDLFFPNAATSPTLHWQITAVSLDPGVTRAVLQIGGAETDYGPGGAQPAEISWPDTRQQSVRLTFSPEVPGQPLSIGESGAWALFRLFDRGTREEVPGLSDRVRVTFHLGARKAVYELHANSVLNALTMKELGGFRCPSHL
jgi:type VI secretion system protein ImpL